MVGRMAKIEEAQIRQLAGILSDRFDGRWTEPNGWPDRADLALLDSVFSTRARYETVVRPLVLRWRDHDHASTGGLSDLLAVDRATLVGIVRNEQKVPGRSPDRLLKVDAVLQVAQRMIENGWNLPPQIADAAITCPKDLSRVFQSTSGVGPAQLSYFLMLLGIPGIKPDTLLTAWIEREMGLEALSQNEVVALARGAADLLGMSPTVVDHTIWSDESKFRSANR